MRDAETLAALVVAAGLGGQKGGEAEAEQLWRCVSRLCAMPRGVDAVYSELETKYPAFPMVKDVTQKAELFDELAAKFEVPPLAVATA